MKETTMVDTLILDQMMLIKDIWTQVDKTNIYTLTVAFIC